MDATIGGVIGSYILCLYTNKRLGAHGQLLLRESDVGLFSNVGLMKLVFLMMPISNEANGERNSPNTSYFHSFISVGQFLPSFSTRRACAKFAQRPQMIECLRIKLRSPL